MKKRKVYGFPIVIEISNGKQTKRPLIKDWQKSDILIDDVNNPSKGILIPQNVVVIDIDSHKGVSKEDIEAELGVVLDERGFLQNTINGGKHYAYEVPEGVNIRQGTNLLGIEGFDTRVAGKGWIATGIGYDGNASEKIQEELPDLPLAAIERLAIREKKDAVREVHAFEITDEFKNIEDALNTILEPDYQTWVDMGMALRHVPNGFYIWDQWSSRFSNYKHGETEYKWETFPEHPQITPASIYYLAMQNNWKNPNKIEFDEGQAIRELTPIETLKMPHPLSVPWGGDHFAYPSFLIDGVLSDKLSLLAAYPGKGKTTALATLACVVAGLVKVPDLNIDAARRVVFVSEHPEQVALMLHVIGQRYGVDQNALREAVILVEAQRMDVAKLIRVRGDWDQYAVEATIGDVTQTLKPWVILDTYSATIDMTDENSNAEGGRIMSTIKQGLTAYGYPVTICAHTSKVHKHGSADAMSARGASAFEGDASQILFLSVDDADNRFIEIAIPKHRFQATVHSIQLSVKIDEVSLVDSWGRLRKSNVLTADLVALDDGQRELINDINEEAKEEYIEKKKRNTRKRIEEGIITILRRNRVGGVNVTQIRNFVTGKNSVINEVLADMETKGEITAAVQGRSTLYFYNEQKGTTDTDDVPF